MMSKPVIRIAILALIGILVLAGIFATVQAASATAGKMSGSHFLTAGLLPDQKHVRESKPRVQPYVAPEGGNHEGGGCERDRINSSDL